MLGSSPCLIASLEYLALYFLLISRSLRRPLIGASWVFASRFCGSRPALRRPPGSGSVQALTAAARRSLRYCGLWLSPAWTRNTQHVAHTTKDEKQRQTASHSCGIGRDSRSAHVVGTLTSAKSRGQSQLACWKKDVTLSSLWSEYLQF